MFHVYPVFVIWVIRRVGGLEDVEKDGDHGGKVIRRVGGLEVEGYEVGIGEDVIRRVGGLIRKGGPQ